MEEVLKVEYDKSSFPGKYITEEEREKHNLKKEEEKDDLWYASPSIKEWKKFGFNTYVKLSNL